MSFTQGCKLALSTAPGGIPPSSQGAHPAGCHQALCVGTHITLLIL